MPKQSRTIHAVDQAEKPESRHLPLVDQGGLTVGVQEISEKNRTERPKR
jgi:hypothetical protein